MHATAPLVRHRASGDFEMIVQTASAEQASSVRANQRSITEQLIVAALLGAVVVWGVVFSPSPLAHNAAHDVRHVAGMPCH